MPTLSFTTLAVLSAVFAALVNLLARVLVRGVKSQQFISLYFLVMAAMLAVCSPLFYHFVVSLKAVGLVLLIGMLDGTANYFYFKTFETTEASVATPILSLAPAFAFLFGWLFLGDVVSLRTLLLALAIMATIIAFSADFRNFRHFRRTSLVPALSCALLFGISAIPSKELLSQMHAINPPTLFMFRAGLIALMARLVFANVAFREVSVRQYQLIVVRGGLVIAQWVLLYSALSRGNVGVAVTLANTTPVFVFGLSVVFLRERPTLRKVAAAGLVLALSLLI